jgi:hypothetical protein
MLSDSVEIIRGEGCGNFTHGVHEKVQRIAFAARIDKGLLRPCRKHILSGPADVGQIGIIAGAGMRYPPFIAVGIDNTDTDSPERFDRDSYLVQLTCSLHAYPCAYAPARSYRPGDGRRGREFPRHIVTLFMRQHIRCGRPGRRTGCLIVILQHSPVLYKSARDSYPKRRYPLSGFGDGGDQYKSRPGL